jgi:hypothetical protein
VSVVARLDFIMYLDAITDILMFQAAAKAVQNDKNSEFALAPDY